MLRQPAVAGYFYPAEKEKLLQDLAGFIPEKDPIPATAIVVPHAGYMYSGHVAGEVYGSIRLPHRFIILCPNHTGFGSDFDLYPEGEWLTPLGKVKIDSDLFAALRKKFPRATVDGRAHLREHSLEVQLPFLQYLKGDFTFVPLCVRRFEYQYLEELGHALAEVVKAAGSDVLLIASSDMTHYERQESANRKDRLAIAQMEKMDPPAFYDTVHQNNITMCGYLPTTSTMIAAKELGSIRATLVKYATSGDITGDYTNVVGYAGLVMTA